MNRCSLSSSSRLRGAALGALFAVVLALGAPDASAQAWPSRTVKIVVPTSAGGGTDTVARAVAQKLGEAWGQPVVVENRPGANQIIGGEAVAKSPPDGYTLIVSDAATFVINPHLYPKLPYDALRDFAPVSLIVQLSPVLAANASLPAGTVQELIAAARARPGAIAYGSFGSGSYAHISMESFRQQANVDLLHVPFKGSAPALADLLSGRISLMLVTLSVVEPHVKSGKLKLIAAATPKRLATLPDLPTIAESGLPGFEASGWFGMLAPAGTPPAIVTKIRDDVAKALAAPELREQFLKGSLEPVGNTPEQFAARIRADYDHWGRLVKATGAKPD